MTESTTNLARLASFPEQNPNPVMEVSMDGKLTYANPAALRYFPDINQSGFEHAIFKNVKKKINNHIKNKTSEFKCETNVDNTIFEQKVYIMNKTGIIRIYSSDITERQKTEKKLTNLALFPEQNPNLVIEINLSTKKITYFNPASTRYFPDITEQGYEHGLFKKIKNKINSLQLHEINNFQCEVEIGEEIFEQKIYLLEGGNILRVYSSDITEQKMIEKNLARLASFPEQNPNPVIEVNFSGEVTYMNPVAKNRFTDLIAMGLEHPIFKPLKNNIDDFRNHIIQTHLSEIRVGTSIYEQKIILLSESNIIRIFSFDITERKMSEEIIREKNKDITDSINYAKKIQQAILPPIDFLNQFISESFVLYKPKDIVSGDFYWFSQIDNIIFIAAADCTGHGVPGALMSMIGNNILNHIVNEKMIKSPGGVLNELDKRVKRALKQSGENTETNDGMDISLCCIDIDKKILQYAGANRPLLMIRNKELTEYNASKFAIGGQHRENKLFSDNTINLKSGDTFYLYTDGYTDQFGGIKGKKFMKRKFHELLSNICHYHMNQQKIVLEQTIEEWKLSPNQTEWNHEQIDDILVIGFKI